MAVRQFLRPTSVSEAVVHLSERQTRVPLAGGTFLSLHTPERAQGLVDLSRARLRYIKERDDKVTVGAMSTFADIAGDSRCGALSEILANTATEPLRHMITVGGNLMIPLRWSDLPLVLTVLNATVVLRQRGRRCVPIGKLLAQSPRQFLRHGELLTEVRLPKVRQMQIARRKLLRMHDDIPALHVAVALRVPRTRVRDVRIGFVAQKPLPTRLRETERVLENARPGVDIGHAAAEAAVAECGTLSDPRYSSAYLREMLGVFVRSCVTRCMGVDCED